LFGVLQSRGVSLAVSTYVPILLTAAVVTLLELVFPHRTGWQPPSGEVKTDLVFMTIVQLAFPPLVSFLFVYALVEPARSLELPIGGVWPHGWPIWMQAVLMVLAVDPYEGNPPDARALAAAVDRRLGELNIEYHAKRTSGRLGPLSVAWLAHGTAEAYKAAAVRAGQREGQYKPTVLEYARNLVMRLDDYVTP
jgi:hypothetical protein